MKKFKVVVLATLLATVYTITSCGGPNGDKGSTDDRSSTGKEGAVDSSRLIKEDTTAKM